MARDEEANRSALAMMNTPRWAMARHDAATSVAALTNTFSCSLGISLSQAKTPKTFALLQRTVIDAGGATNEAKNFYRRPRPYMVNDKPNCTPEADAALRASPSYPSGHSSAGWAIGLVLSEISPTQTNAILERARAFGESREICNVHWRSDVQAGQLVASAVVARLHAEAAFRDDVAAARAEVEAVRALKAPLNADCDIEAQTLKSWR